ncbi:hypothetical protein DES53_108223 [Roseimicrobium gellanilyticum]|uniref:Uncharacterized protein n=1 Tax=Roseimicrobium gellanilyticum TaxID=748857 RepID=A0A366HDM6_9BACT|nr:hypothetical protein [Roseimicrobium gellanilyticum]RBP40516.1 hypothetical protein DES53_108223 [Roseimicrobium gellanilyticum]
MEPTPENLKAFGHARWRVKFTAHLITLHEGVGGRGSPDWELEHAEHVNRHRLAEESLAAFPAEWAELYP